MIWYSLGALALLVLCGLVYLAGVRHGLTQAEPVIADLRVRTKRIIGELTARHIEVVQDLARTLHTSYQQELEREMAHFVATYTEPAEPWK